MIADKHITNYINRAKKIPLLTKEQEITLATEALKGNNKAGQDLASANLLLVVKVANEYVPVFSNLDDLIEEGNIGLLRSIKKYNPTKGYRFSTYATWWIRSMILRYIFNNSHMIKPGTTNEERKLFYNLRKEQKRLTALGVEYDTATIANNLDVDEEDVVNMDGRLRKDISIDNPLPTTDDHRVMDMSSDPIKQPDNMVADNEFSCKFNTAMERFGKKLKNKRHKEIFNKRIIAEEPETLQILGDRFGLTRERMRQNEEEIMTKLRNYIKRAKLI